MPLAPDHLIFTALILAGVAGAFAAAPPGGALRLVAARARVEGRKR